MREILFRGKRICNGEWIDGIPFSRIGGGLTPHGINSIRRDDNGKIFGVIAETVGQYTGCKDKNGKKIFEGDIIKCKNYHGKVRGFVAYCNWSFYLSCSSGFSDEYLFNCSDIEVIGNIHDNPELLEVKK